MANVEKIDRMVRKARLALHPKGEGIDGAHALLARQNKDVSVCLALSVSRISP